jgi:hypothetical protein
MVHLRSVRSRHQRGPVWHCKLILAIVVGMSATASPVRSEEPTPRRAFFMSLLLPGWGQHALGEKGRSATFLGIEAISWLGFAGIQTMRGIYEDDYRAYAASVAGADLAGKDRTYFDDLSFYDTRVEHNQAALVSDQMDDGGPVLYGATDDWQWPTHEDRQRYRGRYNSARRMDQRLDYILLAISLNHLASAVDAAKIAGRHATERQVDIRFVPIYGGGGKMVVSFR